MSKSPLNWYGGKANMSKKIISIIQQIPHTTYCEVFGGGGHIIFEKAPSLIDVYNDINCDVVQFFRVLREKPDELIRQLELTPYAREEFNLASLPTADDVERARRFYVKLMQSFSNKGDNWSYGKSASRRHMSIAVSRWLGNVDTRLPGAVARLQTLQIENQDFAQIIARYDTPETLFYLDPPYLPDTRVSPDVYKHEMTYADHERLVQILQGIKGKAILSGYDNTLYDSLGWYKHVLGDYALSAARSVGKNATKNYKTEILWIRQ